MQNFNALSDEELVEKIREHPENQEIWTVFYQRFERLIGAIAYRFCQRCNCPQYSEDMAQEINTALVEGVLLRYEGRGSVSAFVQGTARYVSMDWTRRNCRIVVSSEEGDAEIEEALRLSEAGQTSSPIDDVQIYDIIEIALLIRDNLNRNRFQLIWFMVEDFSHREIGYVLDITEEASRARRRPLVLTLKQLTETENFSRDDLGEAIKRLEYLFEKIRKLYQVLAKICGRHNIASVCQELRQDIERLGDSIERELGVKLRDKEKLSKVIMRLNHPAINKRHEEANKLVEELREELDGATEKLYTITADELREAIRSVYDETTD